MGNPVDPDYKSLVYVPLDELATPKHNHVCIKDHYWIVHPERGAVFFQHHKNYPAHIQANKTEEISIRIRDVMYPWAKVELVPLAFVVMNVSY